MPDKIPTFKPNWQPTSTEIDRAYDKHARDKARNAFYHSKPWRSIRPTIFLRDLYTCQMCLHNIASEIDHKIPLELRPDLALEPSNLQALCRKCHLKKRKEEKRR